MIRENAVVPVSLLQDCRHQLTICSIHPARANELYRVIAELDAAIRGPHAEFQLWFKSREFYSNLVFQHGDRLFDKDGGIYRVLAVRIAYEAFLEK